MPFCCDNDGHNDADENENVENMRCPYFECHGCKNGLKGPVGLCDLYQHWLRLATDYVSISISLLLRFHFKWQVLQLPELYFGGALPPSRTRPV